LGQDDRNSAAASTTDAAASSAESASMQRSDFCISHPHYKTLSHNGYLIGIFPNRSALATQLVEYARSRQSAIIWGSCEGCPYTKLKNG
jgi:hypothetical protein